MGDSILSQIREDKLCKKGTIKVRCFPGAKFEDFYHYAIPFINKKPDRIVLHMGTNNDPYCTPEKMVGQILGLKNFILQKLPTCEIIISSPTLRKDNTTANNRKNLFINHLKKLNIKLILNDNIEKKHLNYRELHLHMSGVIKLSEKLVRSIQSWYLEDSCHVSTTESIGNHFEFVSKIDLLPDINVENSYSTVENGVNGFIEYLQNLRI